MNRTTNRVHRRGIETASFYHYPVCGVPAPALEQIPNEVSKRSVLEIEL
jgi:hypothetical protein